VVIDEQKAIALFRGANPVPDLDSYQAAVPNVAAYRSRIEQRSREVTDLKTKPRDTTPRRPALAAWSGIAIVAVLGAIFVLLRANETNVAAERAPLEIASEYLEAYREFDVDRVESMLTDDAQVLPWESYAPRDWKSDLRFLGAAGFQILLGECREVPWSGAGVKVSCEYDAHGLGSDQIGFEPFSGHAFEVVIQNGLVRNSFMGFDFYSGFSDKMWWPFQRWIKENHPEDFDVLYEDPTLSRQTDDAIALWEQRVEDYVAFVNSQP
jgi:hypothetical protein